MIIYQIFLFLLWICELKDLIYDHFSLNINTSGILSSQATRVRLAQKLDKLMKLNPPQ